jgi:hypothetical protein
LLGETPKSPLSLLRVLRSCLLSCSSFWRKNSVESVFSYFLLWKVYRYICIYCIDKLIRVIYNILRADGEEPKEERREGREANDGEEVARGTLGGVAPGIGALRKRAGRTNPCAL